MNKLLKSVLCIGLSVGMVLGVTSCGKSGDTVSNDEEYEIIWYNRMNKSRDHEAVFEEISRYTKEKINAKITCIPISNSEFAEKMRISMAANEKFDLTSATTEFTDNVSKEGYLALDDLLEKEGKGILEVMPEYIWDSVRIGGSIYAVPTLKDWASETVVWWNKSLMDKYNFDADSVKQFSDIEPMLKVIKENEPESCPTSYIGTNSSLYGFLPFERINGSVLGAFPNGNYDKIVNWLETDEAMDFFKMMREWYLKGYLRKDAATVTSTMDIENAGRVFSGYGASLPYYEDQLNEGYDDARKIKFLHINSPKIMTSDVQASMQAISRTTENAEKTMKFLNMLYTDADLLNMVVYGIEGTHYTMVDETHLRYPDGIKMWKDNNYYGNAAMQGNRYLLKLVEGTPDDIWEKYQQFNDDAVKSEALGFVFDSSSLTSEIASANNVYSEFIPAILCGSVDPEVYVPQAIEKFKKAGIDKIIDEVNKQYSEWRAAKGK